ncbi:MAG: nucleotidyltransferase family protein [Crocinitomicaceae bacterium]
MDQQVKEAIVLAGGFGLRLRSEIGELPKSLARVNDLPFLNYVLNHLKKYGIKKVVLSVGYKWEMISDYYGKKYEGMELVYAIEEQPLGTGGAIRHALEYISDHHFLALNGDTIFDIDLQAFYTFHLKENGLVTIAAKKMQDTGRYGSLQIDKNHKVLQFNEKKAGENGIINGGIYCLSKDIQSFFPDEEKFSFEKDVLPSLVGKDMLKSCLFDGYFIDIGIPEDFQQFKQHHS